jgi:hypothetical protein
LRNFVCPQHVFGLDKSSEILKKLYDLKQVFGLEKYLAQRSTKDLKKSQKLEKLPEKFRAPRSVRPRKLLVGHCKKWYDPSR